MMQLKALVQKEPKLVVVLTLEGSGISELPSDASQLLKPASPAMIQTS
ncbi:MAG: hypothetical protein LDL41_10390 [Coleofasciculus sp. S288]|nr:hypothetical protein [Coleofasciculus sp. S288]